MLFFKISAMNKPFKKYEANLEMGKGNSLIKVRLFDYLLCVFFVVNALRNICLIIALSTIATVLFYVLYTLFFVMIQLSLLVTCKNNECIRGSFIVSFLLLTLLVLVPTMYGFSGWLSKSYLPISFLFTIAFFIMSKSIVVSEATMRFCYKVQVGQAIVTLICSLFPSSFVNGVLELKIGNSNQTAIMLWANFAFIFLYWIKNKYNKKQSFILLCTMVGLIFLICLTKSRTGLLSLAVCGFGYLFVKLPKGKKAFPRMVQVILLCAPVWIPIFVMLLMTVLPVDIVVWNKPLFSGREHIWKNIFEEMIKNPFICHLDSSPYYSKISVNNVETWKAWGCHNGFLSVLWNYGFCVSILVIVVLSNCIKTIKGKINNNFTVKMIYLIVMASIVSLSFEDALLTGNICTTYLIPVLLIFGRSEEVNSGCIISFEQEIVNGKVKSKS